MGLYLQIDPNANVCICVTINDANICLHTLPCSLCRDSKLEVRVCKQVLVKM